MLHLFGRAGKPAPSVEEATSLVTEAGHDLERRPFLPEAVGGEGIDPIAVRADHQEIFLPLACQ